MNVYIGTSGVLKNAYIGEVIHKYIDVRGKTLAQIQAEGWDLTYSKSYTLDSNGISVSANNSWFNLYYPISLTNAHTITLKCTGYTNGGGSGYGGGAFVGINNATSEFGGYLAGVYQSGNNAGGKGTNIRLGFDNILSTSGGNNTSGDINQTFIINLDTGVCTYNITSPVTFNTSATLTSAQLSQVKQYGYIGFHSEEWTTNYIMRLYTANITVEY